MLEIRRGRNGKEGRSLFFRRCETCMPLHVVAKRDGDVYVVGCAYSRVSDACIFSSVLLALSCLTLCDPMDCSPPGFSAHGISSQAEDWSELPFPPPGHLQQPGIERTSTSLAGRFSATLTHPIIYLTYMIEKISFN